VTWSKDFRGKGSSGWTAGYIVYTNTQLVVQPVVQLFVSLWSLTTAVEQRNSYMYLIHLKTDSTDSGLTKTSYTTGMLN